MAVTGSCPLCLQMPSFLQSHSIGHDALVSALTSRLPSLPPQVTWSISQPLPLAALLGTSKPGSTATSDPLTSPQIVMKPITTTLAKFSKFKEILVKCMGLLENLTSSSLFLLTYNPYDRHAHFTFSHFSKKY